jgi:MoaA/NifB/PqqE/SkfB family radical SAM enzyme
MRKVAAEALRPHFSVSVWLNKGSAPNPGRNTEFRCPQSQQSAPRPSGASTPLIDPFGRAISYLRVSVTDRCDFRCFYCMSEHMSFLPKQELLSLEELDRLCSAFVTRGVKKLRLTGGEPLVRRDIMVLFRSLARHLESGALEELTLTTNGSQLTRFAQELADCGVKRINISLDTLDPQKFTPSRAGAIFPRCSPASTRRRRRACR